MALRFSIEGLRFRAGDGMSSNAHKFRIAGRRSKVLNIKKIRAGDRQEDLTKIMGQRQLEIPPMIDVPGLPFRIMKGEVTVGLFSQLVSVGHEITGYNAGDLLNECIGGASGRYLTYLNLFDGRALAEALSTQTKQNWRIPTSDELLAAQELVGHQLSGIHLEWTNTPHPNKAFKDYHFLYSLSPLAFDLYPAHIRCSNNAVRLVEGK